MKFDIFLSYKSEDHEWVNNLKNSLLIRGVSVWLDKDEIRPGDLSANALENGISNSKNIAIIITPESIKSKWVQEEYYRAVSLSKEQNLNIIPCILREAKIPGFLSSRQYIDFTDSNQFKVNVNHLVFPGISGKRIIVESFTHNIWDGQWRELDNLFHEILSHSIIGLSSSRMHEWLSYRKRNDEETYTSYPFTPTSNQHSVIILDMETHGINNCINFIQECRNSKDLYKNIVFIFFHRNGYIDSLSNQEISEDWKKRFSHYFKIIKTDDKHSLAINLRHTWNSVLHDLMKIEKGFDKSS